MVNDKTNGKPNCEQVWREISNYLENDLEPSLRDAMDEHFRTCPACRSVLEGTRNVVSLYRDERMIEMPAGFSRRLERRIAQNVRAAGRPRWSSWSAWMIPVAALLLFAGGLRLANSISTREPLKNEHAQQAHHIPPEMPVIVSAGAKVFHAAGCPFIHNKATERTITAKEAMEQGYVPCLRCMRKYMDTTVAKAGSGSEDDDDESTAAEIEKNEKHDPVAQPEARNLRQ